MSDPRLEVLSTAVSILEELNLDYWVCNGTLLGLVRDGELIPWDTDIDLGIFASAPIETLVSRLEALGMAVVDPGPGSDYVVLQWKGVRLDFNVFTVSDGYFQTLWRVPKLTRLGTVVGVLCGKLRWPLPNWFATLEGYRAPVELVTPTQEAEFMGMNVRLPLNPEAVLEYMYGPTWRVPNEDYNWRIDGANNASDV